MSEEHVSILIAEDERMLLKTISFFLEKKGYTVVPAQDGETAIELLRNKRFDLVVTDINMPYANGMEILHIIRNELKLPTPVIVLTSVGLESTVLNAFDLGASEFITKPFSLPVLAARIDNLLRSRK